MSNKNKDSTRYYSDLHEKSVCEALNCTQTPNSGATKFSCADVYNYNANMLIECKCSMSEKQSFSIKEDWINKLKKEAWEKRYYNFALCFTFKPEGENYYIIPERLMKYLINELTND